MADKPEVTQCPPRFLEGYKPCPFLDEFKKTDADGWFGMKAKQKLSK